MLSRHHAMCGQSSLCVKAVHKAAQQCPKRHPTVVGTMLHDRTKHGCVLQSSVLPPRSASTAPRQTLKASASIPNGSRKCPGNRKRIAEVEFGQLEQIATVPATLGDEHWEVELEAIVTRQ